MRTAFLLFSFLLLTACSQIYRMPDEDEVSTIPTTNNPHIFRDDAGFVPGVKL